MLPCWASTIQVPAHTWCKSTAVNVYRMFVDVQRLCVFSLAPSAGQGDQPVQLCHSGMSDPRVRGCCKKGRRNVAGSTAPPQPNVHNGRRVLANCKARAFLDVFSNVGIKWHLIRRIVGCELRPAHHGLKHRRGKRGRDLSSEVTVCSPHNQHSLRFVRGGKLVT